MLRILAVALLLFSVSVSAMGDNALTSKQKDDQSAVLSQCPETPDCVSSLAGDPARRVDPFLTVEDASSSMERLKKIVQTMPRTTVISHSDTVLKVEFRSLLGFVDDVIFVHAAEEGVIHVRSASRTGKWDLGANRRRVERLRKLYLEAE
jgi:uncharacterized protein (DUF1499 family)